MNTKKRMLMVVAIAGSAGLAFGGPGPSVPSVADVPGKEYSNDRDHEMPSGMGDPHQNLAWDGVGNAWDTFDYTGTLVTGGELPSSNVDALSNWYDAYYPDVTNNLVPMLVSLQTEPRVRFTTNGGAATTGIWATAPQINAARNPDDVDGLEIWGPEVIPPVPGGPPFGFGDDANRFSLANDAGGTAVYHYDANTNSTTPFLSSADIAFAIGRTDLIEFIDVDAMMHQGGGSQWGPGDEIMFSIAPILDPTDGSVIFDGGEIWVYEFGMPANFLFHGGVLWDTAHDVRGHFGIMADPNNFALENINALEAAGALPSPGTVALLTLGGLALRRRRA